MRKIKFRVWDKEDCEMHQCVTVGCTNDDRAKQWNPLIYTQEHIVGGIDHKEFEIMQYTGLKDKNGKEIFEGDIVEVEAQCIGGRDFKGVVKFYDCSFFIDNGEDVILLFDEVDPRIVLGNIYEHPELLGVPND